MILIALTLKIKIAIQKKAFPQFVVHIAIT